MSTPSRTQSSDSSDSNIRKRVCKACDRCRLKKSKCDGANPCSRCRADNAICVFGERKKSHDKVYPKGYVEMLEQQQAQLVAALRELYRKLRIGDNWPGAPLSEASNGHPLTHDILERLDLLHMQTENHGTTDGFEEDFDSMQRKLIESGASLVRRRGSISSNSENSHELDQQSPLTYDAPLSSRSSAFSEAVHRGPPTPAINEVAFQRPSLVKRELHVKPIETTVHQGMHHSMGSSAFNRTPWTMPQNNSPMVVSDETMDFMTYESPIGYDSMMYAQYAGHAPTMMASMPMADFNDSIDMDFTNFIASTS